MAYIYMELYICVETSGHTLDLIYWIYMTNIFVSILHVKLKRGDF